MIQKSLAAALFALALAAPAQAQQRMVWVQGPVISIAVVGSGGSASRQLQVNIAGNSFTNAGGVATGAFAGLVTVLSGAYFARQPVCAGIYNGNITLVQVSRNPDPCGPAARR
ncbi:hypothetical protein E8L99_16565 [Phreatobacter aquaticus]|uniref:Uncharacterized protein n=1 Tax=Phreatobacter aquaticus TaxID=2570229 RepID=A0A4D7QJJ0_9HYPH|nr:hypothetical protein [Phreatobacter aquaticus]QCK87255.1 hypothetical protein E8L99_16565 [Phreatobacter aquaticus]